MNAQPATTKIGNTASTVRSVARETETFFRQMLPDKPTDPRFFPMWMAGIRCPRALYFRANGDTIVLPDSVDGTLADEVLHAALKKGARDVEAHVAVTIEEKGYLLRGVADCVIAANGKWNDLVVRIRSSEDVGWVREKPVDAHRLEANLLAHGLGARRWSVVYVDDGTGEIVEHAGDVNRVSVEWCLELFATVAEARVRGVAPACPVESGESSEPCKCKTSRIAR